MIAMMIVKMLMVLMNEMIFVHTPSRDPIRDPSHSIAANNRHQPIHKANLDFYEPYRTPLPRSPSFAIGQPALSVLDLPRLPAANPQGTSSVSFDADSLRAECTEAYFLKFLL